MDRICVIDKGLRRETYGGKSFGETTRSDNSHVIEQGGMRADGTYVTAAELNRKHAEFLAQIYRP